MGTPDNSKGISLGEKTRWVIKGLSEYEPFFRNLARLLPDSGAFLYLEGVSISSDVRKFFEKYSVPAPRHYLAKVFNLPFASFV